jgi:hypothetical protein
MRPLPVQTLAIKANLVLHGKVPSTTVQRDPQGRIYTAADLLVTDVFKGDIATNHFTLVHSGGILGEEVSVAPGEVEYAIGEEVVCFLVLNKRGEGVSIGLAQGKFQVTRDPDTGEALVHNLFLGRNPSGKRVAENINGLAVENRLTLARLKAQVKEGAQ